MKAIMVMYDSLRLDILSAYRNSPIDMPNFERLAKMSVRFKNNYVCSLPCMPARRELHTGRPNFLHRSWGPIEPYDDSMPEILHKAGIHSHLSTDHYHYLEDGGATYQGRYSTWDCFRGQAADQWVGNSEIRPSVYSPHLLNPQNQVPILAQLRKSDGWYNKDSRSRYTEEKNYPQTHTFDNGIDFINRNAKYDNWFVQIETFDPHEPFDSPDSYQKKFFDPDEDYELDWPPYGKTTEDDKTIESMRKKYYALAMFCDKSLGRVLDTMDALNLWEDTMLIVNTDHGFMLGEHNWWAKGRTPEYNEIAHTPLFIWDPRYKVKDESRNSLVQTIDLAPTLLDYFGLDIPEDMMGKPLGQVIEDDHAVREYGIYGYHGGPVNITDGRYVYMRVVRTPEQKAIEYTLMPTHMKSLFSLKEMKEAEFVDGFSFTKGCKVMKIPTIPKAFDKIKKDLLFDLLEDPNQNQSIIDQQVEARMVAALKEQFIANDAPKELYTRYGLD